MYERKDREEREAREALANIKIILAERDTLIRQRAADLEALNAVQALHAQAVAERDEARRQVEVIERAIAGVTASFEEADAQRLALTQALREAILAHARSGNVAGPLMRGAKLLHNMGVKL